MPDSALHRRKFMAVVAGATASYAAQSARPPANVVLILADDMGYGDLECYGSQIPTPHLNRMASEGIRFTNFNVANPVCSPSRAAILTGRYPGKVGVPAVLGPRSKSGLATDEVTLAGSLKRIGYKTMCIGKWHLGTLPQYLPTSRGFDSYFGIPYSNDMSPRVMMQDTKIIEQTAELATLTPRYTEQAVKFIERSKDSPFFLYLAHTFPHIPLGVSPRFRGKSSQGLYGDVVRELDWCAGEIFSTLKRLGLDSNTLVLFTSDNGPWYEGSPGRLRGRKSMNYEGGVREPFIARFPGRVPAGKVCNGLASGLDLYPTIARLCGAPAPSKPLDGIDIWPLLSGAKDSLQRDVLLYFFDQDLQAARIGNWKLHISRYNWAPDWGPDAGRVNLPVGPELYNLDTDPDESFDVASRHPEIVSEMMRKTEDLLQTFPEETQEAYRNLRRRKNKETRSGAPPIP